MITLIMWLTRQKLPKKLERKLYINFSLMGFLEVVQWFFILLLLT